APREHHADAGLGVPGRGDGLGDRALDVRARGHTQPDPRPRPLQAHQVVAGREQPSVDGPDRLVNAVPVEEPSTEDRYLGLLGSADSTVNVYADGHARVRT